MIRPTVQSLLCAESQMGLQGCLAASRRDLPRRDETQFFITKTTAECHGSTCTRMTRRCEFYVHVPLGHACGSEKRSHVLRKR